MRHVKVRRGPRGFRLLAETRRSQAAEMVLAPGESTGGDDNVHEGSDQWLYVVSGTGRITVAGRKRRIGPGSLVLIEAGETHEVRASEGAPLVTVNVYAPPEY